VERGGLDQAQRQRFSSTTPTPINDLSVATSVVAAAGLSGSITDVTVRLYLTHTYDADLRLWLISPDGTSVLLANQRGGSGDNYGNTCASGTVFDDAAATFIYNGTPPFAGTYRPEQPLSTFLGKSGTAINGDWTLRVDDIGAGDVGQLLCWSVTVTTAATAAPDPSVSAARSPALVPAPPVVTPPPPTDTKPVSRR
jgi:subtilisin-like proprotein convertase family protein